MNRILAFPWLLFPLLLVILLASRSADAQVARETPLMTRALTDVPGREVPVETVILAPGEVPAAHRHNADVFACSSRCWNCSGRKGGSPTMAYS